MMLPIYAGRKRSRSVGAYGKTARDARDIGPAENGLWGAPAFKRLDGRDLHYAHHAVPPLPRNRSASASLDAWPMMGTFGLHEGLFVGESHANRDTMRAFEQAWPRLTPKLNVVFLEYYPRDESPQGKSVEQIEADLTRFNKDFGDGLGRQTAEELHRMCAWAARHGIDIVGIDDRPKPPGEEKSGRRAFEYFRLRVGSTVNRRFLGSVERYAARKGREKTYFCMYVGQAHLANLKKLAEGVPAYQYENGRLVPLSP